MKIIQYNTESPKITGHFIPLKLAVLRLSKSFYNFDEYPQKKSKTFMILVKIVFNFIYIFV